MGRDTDRSLVEPPGGLPPSVEPGSPARGIRLRVLVPLALAIAFLLGAFVFMSVRETQHRRAEDVARAAKSVDDLLRAQLTEGVQVMSSIMQLVLRDQRLEQALREHDRDTLLAVSAPILKDIRARNRISHFYYILLDRTMLLRVQVPDEWGDKVERFVLLEAQRTGKPYWGNEQGPFGSLHAACHLPLGRQRLASHRLSRDGHRVRGHHASRAQAARRRRVPRHRQAVPEPRELGPDATEARPQRELGRVCKQRGREPHDADHSGARRQPHRGLVRQARQAVR